MHTASSKSNGCLHFMDLDPAKPVAYEATLEPFQAHTSELFEIEADDQGLKHARVQEPECMLLERQLPEIKLTGFLTEQAEVARDFKVSPVIHAEFNQTAPPNINQLSAKAQREQREQQMLREKTEALEQLRQAEAKYRTLVEQIPVITYIASLETPLKLLFLSPQISHLGFPEQDWLNDSKGLLKRIHPDDLVVTIEAYAYTYEHHVPLRCEYRLSKIDGNYRWFRDEANVVRNEAGESLFLQGVLVDITKNKETEQELSYYRQRLEELVCTRTEQLEKQCVILKSANASLDKALVDLKRVNSDMRNSERRFRLLLDAVGEGIVGLDTHGHCSFINRTALLMLGHDENEVIGHDILSMIGQPQTDALALTLDKLGASKQIQDQVSQRCNTHFMRKDGHSFPVAYLFYPVAVDGLVDSVVLVFWDMTASHAQIQNLEYLTNLPEQRSLTPKTGFVELF